MNNGEPFIVYSYAVSGDQIYQLKPADDPPNAQEISLASTGAPANIIQLVPANTIVQTSNATQAIQIVENIQLHPPTISIDSTLSSEPPLESNATNSNEIQVEFDSNVVQDTAQSFSTDESQKVIVVHVEPLKDEPVPVQRKPAKPPTKKALDKLKSMQKMKPPSVPEAAAKVKLKTEPTRSKKKPFIYECDVCESRFLAATSLKLHKTGHRYGPPEEKKTWICRFCGRHFSHQQTLGDHEKIHIDEVRYDCEVCGAKYHSKSGLRNHLAKNAVCEETFRDRKLLRKKEEEDEKSHECDVCGKKYRHRKSMLEHRSLHYKSKQNRCDRCGAMFETAGGWRKHVASGRCEFSKCKFKKDAVEEGDVFIPEERKKFLEQVEKVKQKQQLGGKEKQRVSSSSSENEEGDQNDLDEQQMETPPIVEDDEGIANSPEVHATYQEIPILGSPDIKEEQLSDNDEAFSASNDLDTASTSIEAANPSEEDQLEETEHEPQEPSQRKQRKPKVHQCPTCNKVFARSFVLKNHLRTHTGERPFLCDTCSKSFGDSASLKAHLVIHTGEKPILCPECPARFARKSGLRNHITVHFNLPCDQCDQKFPSRKTLLRHKVKHQGIRPFLCEICSKDFRTKADMQAHLRIHNNEKRYTCQICSARFNCPSTLRRHRNVHAPPETRPVCSTCGNSFSSQQALRKHEDIHKNIKPYRCEACSKSFRVKDHLKIHQRSHSGEKPYPCELCQKRFITNGDLKVHMRRHTGEKPFSCDECGEAFVVTARLYRHMQQTGHRSSSKSQAIIVSDITRAT
ncbi:hypothetical protein RP20_CCG027987 [Aedes albopictus]|nr:hypothetical protein RP20_CCG027987 [Aedes albopictus]